MRTATFALFVGIAYVSLGLLGLIPAALIPPPADAPPTRFNVLYGYLLGLFPVNVLHSVVHLAIGAWGIIVWHGVTSPKVFARALAVFYGALALIGVIPGVNTLFGMLPVYGHTIWLHAVTAAVAVYFGWRSEVSVEHRASTTPDRREQMQPVARERRFRRDRREPFGEV
jgi:hypothetical protein